MSEWQYIAELHAIAGEAIGVIQGASMNEGICDDFAKQLADVADRLQKKLMRLRELSMKPDKPPGDL